MPWCMCVCVCVCVCVCNRSGWLTRHISLSVTVASTDIPMRFCSNMGRDGKKLFAPCGFCWVKGRKFWPAWDPGGRGTRPLCPNSVSSQHQRVDTFLQNLFEDNMQVAGHHPLLSPPGWGKVGRFAGLGMRRCPLSAPSSHRQ